MLKSCCLRWIRSEPTKKAKCVFVYNGEGTERVDVVYQSFKDSIFQLKLDDQYCLQYISAKELADPVWMKAAKLLVLPGGRDLPYVRDITGTALDNIRLFIERGGAYLGLCAGAYFSCRYVCFEPNTPLEVVGPRDLKLFLGTAKGSVYPGFKYKSTAGSVTAPVTCCSELKESLGDTSYGYFNGGCEFIPDTGFNEFRLLALYKDFPEKKAMVYLTKGQGKIILSGVHPELDVKFLPERDYTPEQWQRMSEHATKQRELLHWIVKKLLS